MIDSHQNQLPRNNCPFPDRDRWVRCTYCLTYIGMERDGTVLYFWDGPGNPGPEQALHAVDPIKLKCGGCNRTFRWRPIPKGA